MKTTLSPLMKCAALLAASLALHLTSHAQNTVWSNAAGGDWNTAANWNPNFVPGAGTNAFMTNLVAAYAVTYSAPMTAASITSLSITNSTVAAATLNVNAAGFNVSGNISSRAGSKINVGSGGAIASGSATFTGSGNLVIVAGAAVTNNGTLGIGSSAPGTGAVTNNGGTLITGGVTIGASADGGPLVLIGNNLSSLGNLSIGRCGGGNSAPPGLASGVVVSNGVVTMTSAVLGAANSWGNLTVVGGVVTNTGDFILGRQSTTTRGGRFTQFGGTVVSTSAGGVRMNVNNASQISIVSVQGGTNIAEGYVLGDSTVANGTVNFTNAGVMVLGGIGLSSSNSGTTLNVSLNNGGIFYAKADWVGSVPMLLASSSTFTFNAGDLDGTAHNISLYGALRGTGHLNKTGAGTLTLNAANTNQGSTLVNGGALALAASGSLSNSTPLIVGSGTTLDVSAVSGGFVLNGAVPQKLSGLGSVGGTVTASAGAIIDPGSNSLSGTLTFANDLVQAGNVINHLDAVGDKIVVTGLFNVSGTNTFEVAGSIPPGTAYPLVQYGSFNGDITNFVVTLASGTLSNSVVNKTIYLVVAASIRAATNVTWVGNSVNNNWDVLNLTNWLNNGALDYFVGGDSVLFNGVGAPNPIVNLATALAPGSVTVDAAANYTFQGAGSIAGTGGLTKTNSGTLTIMTANTYTGPTIIGGGVLEATNLANGGLPSSIGQAISDPSTLVFNGDTLRYLSDTVSSDHAATLNAGLQTLDVASNTTVLTIAGPLSGSGILTKTGPGQLTLGAANTYAGGTVISNGILRINSTGLGSGIITNYGSTLTLAVANNFANSLNVNGNCLVDLANISGDNALNGAWSGSGHVTIQSQRDSGRTFTMGGGGNNGGNMAGFTGTLDCGTNAGSIRFNDTSNNNLGSTNAIYDIGTGSATLMARNGGITISLGELRGGVNTKLSGRGNGTASTLTYSIGGKDTSSTFDGIIKDGGNATAIIKVGLGTLNLSGASTYTGSTTVNLGAIALTGTASIGASSSINVVAGATLEVSGLATPTLAVGANQTLQGRGTILGGVDSTSGLRIAPGGGVGGGLGTLTATNAITLGGTTWMKLNRASSPNSDRLVSSLSTITYGGTLLVTNIGAALQIGDTFDLFDGAGLGAATFTTLQLPNYIAWDTTSLGLTGIISVSGFLPGPTLSSISNDGVNVTLNGSNGAPNGAFTLLSSTNLALPLASWTTVTTGTFDGTGAINPPLVVPVDPAASQQFYLLKVQ